MRLAQATAAFIGKQVFTRATLGIYDLANARASIYTGIKILSNVYKKSTRFSNLETVLCKQ